MRLMTFLMIWGLGLGVWAQGVKVDPTVVNSSYLGACSGGTGFSVEDGQLLQVFSQYYIDEYLCTLPNLGPHYGSQMLELSEAIMPIFHVGNKTYNYLCEQVPNNSLPTTIKSFIPLPRQVTYYQEANPISRWFFNNHLESPNYILGCSATYGVTKLLKKFDGDHLKGVFIGTSNIFLAVCTIAEIKAIHTWAGLGPHEVQWTILNLQF